MHKNTHIEGSFSRRARMSSGEIALALAVTVAAVAYILSALSGSEPETASFRLPAPAIHDAQPQ